MFELSKRVNASLDELQQALNAKNFLLVLTRYVTANTFTGELDAFLKEMQEFLSRCESDVNAFRFRAPEAIEDYDKMKVRLVALRKILEEIHSKTGKIRKLRGGVLSAAGLGAAAVPLALMR